MTHMRCLAIAAGLSFAACCQAVPNRHSVERIIRMGSYQKKDGLTISIPGFLAISAKNSKDYERQLVNPLVHFRYERALSRAFQEGSGGISGIGRIVLINL
jgi:hypothetical protein